MAGSIKRRGPYSFQLRVYRGEVAGRKQYATKTIKYPEGTSEAHMGKENEKALAALITDIERGTVSTAPKITLGAFAVDWMHLSCKDRLSPVTYAHYKHLLEGRIFPALGHKRLAAITPRDLMAFYKSLQQPGVRKDGKAEKGLSPKSIKDYHACLSSLFTAAMRMQYIVKNPMDGVAPPKVPRPANAAYTPDQAMTMLEALEAEDTMHRAAVHLALFCGLRLGEICGLEFQDIDAQKRLIRIERASKYVVGSGIITKEPKTASGRRAVPIPAHLLELLWALKKEKAAERLQKANLWQEHGRLMTQWDGKPINPDSLSKWWRNFQERAGLQPVIRFHDLRHTSATLQLAQGVDMKTVSANLGHSLVSTTMDIYAHALEQKRREGAEALENLLIHSK